MLSWTQKPITTSTKSTYTKKKQSKNYKLSDGSFILLKREKLLLAETQEFWFRLQTINYGSMKKNRSLPPNPVATKSITLKI